MFNTVVLLHSVSLISVVKEIKSTWQNPIVCNAQCGAEIHVQDNYPVKYKGCSHLEGGQEAKRMGPGLWTQSGQG